jgi:DNA polymerase-3 subunit alpha
LQREPNPIDTLSQEFEVLGFFLSKTPLELWRPILQSRGYRTFRQNKDVKPNESIEMVVMVHSIRVFRTKKQQLMAVIKAFDETGNMDVIIFPSVFEQSRTSLQKNNFLLIKGTLQKEETVVILAQSIEIFKLEESPDEKNVTN